MTSVKKNDRRYFSNWIVFPAGLVLMVPYGIWQNRIGAIVLVFGFAIAISAVVAGTANFVKTVRTNRKEGKTDTRLPSSEKHHGTKSLNTWVAVLAVIAICTSLASAGFSAFVYLTIPQSINSYAQQHKSELRGEKGDTGPQGPQGYRGDTGASGYSGSSYNPIHCSTYDYSYGSSTNCY